MQLGILPAINQLPANIAVLDPSGVILSVNNGWRLFARENGLADPAFCVGANYLAACAGPSASGTLVREIEELLDGSRGFMARWYPCHHPADPKRWFILVGMRDETRNHVTLAHVDLTTVVDLETMLRLEAGDEAVRMDALGT